MKYIKIVIPVVREILGAVNVVKWIKELSCQEE